MVDGADAQDTSKQGEDMWFLQKQDGSEYGPEALGTLARWAAESRIVSGNKLSQDRKTWTPVADIPELGMEWVAELPDGRRYGPFNIEATGDLVAHKVLPDTATLTHRDSGRTTTVSEHLSPSDTPPDPAPDTPVDEAQPDAAAAAPKRARRKSPARKKTERPQDDLFGELPDEAAAVEEVAVPDEQDEADPDGPTISEQAQEPERPEEKPEEPADEQEQAPKDADAEPSDNAEEVQVLTAQIERLKTRLAESDKERRAATRQFKESQAASIKLAEERDGARKLAVTQEAQFKEKLATLEQKIEQERPRIEAQQQQKESLGRDANQSATELEQRLDAALAELKKTRNGEVKAAEALKTVESQLARKTAIQDKRLQDLLNERSKLAQMVESETSRIKRLHVILVGVAIMAVILVIVLLQRGCHATEGFPPDNPQIEEGRIASPAPPRDGIPSAESRTAQRLSFPVIRGTDGAKVTYSRAGSVVVFDEGVFQSGTTLSPQAKQILIKLAPQIRPFLSEYDLLVEGHTDNRRLRGSSKYKSNTDLARDRAETAAQFISEHCGIPMSAMHVLSAGSGNPPYPNDTSESRAKNRTIVLRLLRHADN